MTRAKLAEIQSTLRADTISLSGDVLTIRRGFFYTKGYTAEALANKVKAAYPDAEILDAGEVWKEFRGNAPVAKSSHWYVKFKLPGVHVARKGAQADAEAHE